MTTTTQILDPGTLIEELAAIEPFPGETLDVLLERPDELTINLGTPAVHAAAHYRWPVRRNDEGCTGATRAVGPARAGLQWRFGWNRHIQTLFPRPPMHAPVISGSHGTFTDAADPLLIRVDRGGSLVWSDRSFRYQTEPVVTADGTVFAGAHLVSSSGQAIGFLVALEGATGNRKYAAMTQERFSSLYPLEIGLTGRIIGVLGNPQGVGGELYAFDPATGSEWRQGGRLTNGWPRVWSQAHALAYQERIYTWGMVPAAGAGNTIYLSAFDEVSGAFLGTAPALSVPGLPTVNGVLAVSPTAGQEPRLVFTLGPFSDLICFQDLALSQPAQVVSVSAALGRQIYIEDAPAIREDGEIYVVGHDGNYQETWLVALDPHGNVVWDRRLASPPATAPIVDAEGQIYVGTRDAVEGFAPGGHQLFQLGLQLNCGDSLSMDETGQLYFHDGGLLCAAA